jgi:23S rRNA pseudouridine1911/1915/1917 synthase
MKIIFEDAYLIVCEKMAGVPVETAKIGSMDMVSELKNYVMNKTGDSYIGVVHRLDQPVEGIMVFAKNSFAAAELSKQISQNKMKKHYLAVLCGKPSSKRATLVDYLLKNGKTNTSSVVDKGVSGAKRSELIYQVKVNKNELSLAEIELITGRHHQIRVQMAHANLPLWGDVKYNKEFLNQRGIMPALCAYKLEFNMQEIEGLIGAIDDEMNLYEDYVSPKLKDLLNELSTQKEATSENIRQSVVVSLLQYVNENRSYLSVYIFSFVCKYELNKDVIIGYLKYVIQNTKLKANTKYFIYRQIKLLVEQSNLKSSHVNFMLWKFLNVIAYQFKSGESKAPDIIPIMNEMKI